MSGNGLITNPFDDLAVVLTSPLVGPGDTIWLRGGTYTGNFMCELAGTSGSPISINAYNDEVVIIDGGLTLLNPHVVARNLHVMDKQIAHTMIGDASFNPTNLSAEAQTWHTRLLAQDVTALSWFAALGTIGHLEDVGEATLFVVTALLSAFRLTHDLQILDMVDVLTQQCYMSLEDADGDGYLEWVWRRTDDAPELYLTDNHMASSGISCLVNQMAYCYALNASNVSPAGINYAARATQWQSFITDHFYPDTGLSADNLRHRTTAGMRGMLYHWRWANLHSSWQMFDTFRSYVLAANRTDLNPEAPAAPGLVLLPDGHYAWDHGTIYPFDFRPPYGWQATNYAQYVFANIVDLALDGVYPFSDLEMARYARTAEFVLTNGLNAIRNNIYDTASGDWPASRMTVWSWLGAGRWSSTIRAFGEAVWNLNTNSIYTAAWMLVGTA